MTTPGESAEPRRGGSDTTVTFGRIELPLEEGTQPGGLSAEEQAAISALPRHSALLVMQRGPSVGSRFLLDAERTVAGRSEHADIFLDDVTVSRKHAEPGRDDDKFVVRDIGSLNGTYVNRNRVDAVALVTGDEVQIGKYRLTFFTSPVLGQPVGSAEGAAEHP
ncbi:FHA domain-containing protein [Oerskovia paurometabola]|uniref:FHA domain-containing protein n=1 Tax=Oerskovia paurometabola TaxID=162170 RepID=A0ABW1XHZ9_9CELL|nr:FHA domain-containing protein [Oerskovia paurometabola]MBM7497441.1 pSer/pThr/pTyr-binding forkhead associated (FHA) protein [Oerskovia paurometabola]